MTKLDVLKSQLAGALRRFEEILREEKTTIVRDAALKRFEFVFDLSWKTMRAWLKEQKGVDCVSPKDCIKAAYRQGLIEYDTIWLQMCDWRNEIAHAYGEEFAEKLYHGFPEILAACQKLAKILHIDAE